MWYIIKNLPLSMLVNTILVCSLFVFLLIKIKPEITWKKIGITAFILVVLTFSVHILIGISKKYNESEYWINLPGYVTSFYSYFCITLLIMLTIYSLLKLCYNNKWLKSIIIIMSTAFIFYSSVIIGYSNDNLSRIWKQSQNRFTLVNKTLDKGLLDEITDENVIIYAGDLKKSVYDFGSGVCAQSFTWRAYFHYKAGKNLNICDNFYKLKDIVKENPHHKIYYITQYTDLKQDDMLLAISEINNFSQDFQQESDMFYEATSNESTLYYYSPHKRLIFDFFIPECNDSPVISINNLYESTVNCNLNAIKIENHNKKEEIMSFKLRSDTPFLVSSFMISNIGSNYDASYYINN